MDGEREGNGKICVYGKALHLEEGASSDSRDDYTGSQVLVNWNSSLIQVSIVITPAVSSILSSRSIENRMPENADENGI